MYCKKCGKEIRDGAKFCPKCGTPVTVKKPGEAYENIETPFVADPEEGEAKRLPIIPIIIGIVVIALAIILLLKFGLPLLSSIKSGPTPETHAIVTETEEMVTETTQRETEAKTNASSEILSETETETETETEMHVEADIDGVSQISVTIPGTVKTDNKMWCLSLDAPKSVYVLNSSGNPQLLNNVSQLYLASASSSNAFDFSEYAEWKVNAKGSLSISDSKVYLIVNSIETISPPAVKPETVSDDKEEKDEDEEDDAVAEEDEYILPDSNSRYLTKSDLAGLSKHDLMLARNEIYARRGRKFKDAELRKYFSSKSWYYPSIEADDFSPDMLNDYERKNIDFIKSYE